MRTLFTLLLALVFTPALAQLDQVNVSIHPAPVMQDEPLVIELEGEWPDGCIPRFRLTTIRPDLIAITDFADRDLRLCAAVITPFRQILDTRSQIDADWRWSEELTLLLLNADSQEDPIELTLNTEESGDFGPQFLPSSGIYQTKDFPGQGLVVARQGETTLLYPLSYDETGATEWWLVAGRQVGSVIFADLLTLEGGRCLICSEGLVSGPPVIRDTGDVVVLTGAPGGELEVRFGDVRTVTYQPLLFGHRRFVLAPDAVLPDLSGDWAFRATVLTPNAEPDDCIDQHLSSTFAVELAQFQPPSQPRGNDGLVEFTVTPGRLAPEPRPMTLSCEYRAFEIVPDFISCAMRSVIGDEARFEGDINLLGPDRLSVTPPFNVGNSPLCVGQFVRLD